MSLLIYSLKLSDSIRVSMRFTTYFQTDNKVMARKRPTIDLDTYSALDAYAIALNEYYKSLRKAGFTETHAFWILSDRDSFPDWIIPNLPNRIDNLPYEDDDED